MDRAVGGSAFARAIALLAGGTAASQLIGVAMLPVIARLFGPGAFGVLAAYAAVLMTILTVAGLRYEFAIPLAETEREAVALLIVALGAVLAFGAASCGMAAMLASGLLRSDSLDTMAPVAWMLPVGVAVGGAYQALRYWAIREKRYSAIASTAIAQGLGRGAVQIAAGVAGAGAGGLVAGEIVGQGAGLFSLGRLAWRRSREMPAVVGWAGLTDTARKYASFPLLMAPASLLNGAGMQLPTLLLAGLYGPSVAGWYFATQRLLGLPVQLVGTATGQAFLGEAATLVREDPDKLARMFGAAMRRLLLLGLAPTLLLVAFGPWGMETLLGSAWRESGVYLQWLAVSFLLKFGFDELINLSMVKRNDYALAWAAMRLALACGAVVLAHAMGWAAVHCIALLGIALAVGYMVKLWLWYRALAQLKVAA